MNGEADSATWDCIVVGAGPAGLNAALVLGRARRRVLVLDSAHPRNYATHEMHGVLGHDGLDPADLRARGRAELARCGVEVVTAAVDAAEVIGGGVRLLSARGADVGRTVLLATGNAGRGARYPRLRGRVGNQRAHLPLLRRRRALRPAPRRPGRRRARRAPRHHAAPVV